MGEDTNLLPFLRRRLVAYTVPSWLRLAAECAEGAVEAAPDATPSEPMLVPGPTEPTTTPRSAE